MAIEYIESQPTNGSIVAAYRPISLIVGATETGNSPNRAPVVYCDIYFGGVFYKTLAKTQPTGVGYEFEFDIQDACQEALQKKIGANGGNQLEHTNQAFVEVVCKFRSSGYDANGFITPEGAAPVQGTGGNPPIAGEGTVSNSFYALNVVLQHDQHQDLATHLSFSKSGTWQNVAHPLSHRKDGYKISRGQSDFYPFFYHGNKDISCIRLRYKLKGENYYRTITNCTGNTDPCNLEVNNVVITFEGGQPDGTFKFSVTWDNPNGTPPNVSFFNFEYFDGVNWVPYTNTAVIDVDEITMNSCVYYVQDHIDGHKFRVTPSCANGVIGTPGEGTYNIVIACPNDVVVTSPSLQHIYVTWTAAANTSYSVRVYTDAAGTNLLGSAPYVNGNSAPQAASHGFSGFPSGSTFYIEVRTVGASNCTIYPITVT